MAFLTRFLLLTIFLSGLLPAQAAKSPSKPGATDKPAKLDQDLVRRLYVEGDFEPAIGILEEFQKSSQKWTREESLMVYKYLGVMYSADQSTREKGKSYFYKLLEVDREAKILDMYVSIVVQEIFKSTLEELMGYAQPPAAGGKSQALAPADGSGVPERKTGSSGEAAISRKSSTKVYWWLGGLGLAAAAAGGYYAYSATQEGSPDKQILLPPDP